MQNVHPDLELCLNIELCSILLSSALFFFSSTLNKIEKNAYICVNPWNAMTHPIALRCSVCHAAALRAGSESL